MNQQARLSRRACLPKHHVGRVVAEIRHPQVAEQEAFSFARPIQQPAVEIWAGQEANVRVAQQALFHRAGCNKAARRGDYMAAMEMDDREHAPRNGASGTRAVSI